MLNGKHILIANTPGIGDLLMLTPVLRRLKELYPRCVLSVVSYAGNLPLVERLPYVDAVYGIEKGKFLGRFRPAVHFLSQDWCIFTTWNPQLAILARFFCVPHRAGVCRAGKESLMGFQHILPPDIWDAKDGESKAAFLARQVFGAIGIQEMIDEACDISAPSAKEQETVMAMLAAKGLDVARGYAVIAPFAKTARSLPVSLIGSVVDYIFETYGIPCIMVNGIRVKTSQDLLNRISMGRLFDVSGETNLMELAAVLQGAKLAVVTDSGPMHMACALGTPTVAVFSTGNWRQWAPKKNCHLVTLDLSCSPCEKETAEICQTQQCIRDITMDMLIEKLDVCMKSSGRNERI